MACRVLSGLNRAENCTAIHLILLLYFCRLRGCQLSKSNTCIILTV